METTATASGSGLRAQKRARPADFDGRRRAEEGLDAVSGDADGSFENEAAEEEEDEDDEEVPTPKAKRKRGAAARAAGWREDQRLIDIVKFNGRVINHVVKRWVEQYEADPKSAIVDILLMIFEACGAKYQLDVESFDADVDAVVVSLVELARNGEVEDHYNTKQKDLRSFKENLASFWEALVHECQNGPLFDKVLFEKCMDYVIALSCTPPRVYRQIATLVGLQLVTSFISVAKTLSSQRETTQRQINAEKKKRSDGPRLESLNKRLSLTHEKITSMEEMMRKIFTGLFLHRYRDVDADIRMSCIKALGVWIVSYPSLFLQDLYLKYLGWTLNDKSAAVRKTSVTALQNLYEVEDNIPSLGLFTARFCNRMIELADDIDISVAVAAIGLLKQLLRHQLLTDDELGPLYDLLIDEPPMIRHAIGELVYDHLIAQNTKGSQSGPDDRENESSEVHIGRLLQILREFSDDPILSAYVIDDIWDFMKAMKDWKCIISMLLDENTFAEFTDVDVTNLVRLLHASARKAVGEQIVPSTNSRRQPGTKAQKELHENSKREITTVLLKYYSQLLRKYIADKAKVAPLVDILVYLKLEMFSLKRQEQSFKAILDLISDAFFKHGEKDTLRSCVKAITFCSAEGQAEIQEYSQNKLKDIESDLILKVKNAIKEVEAGDDEYSLLVNLKRLYELQLAKPVRSESLFEGMASILRDMGEMENEVKSYLLLNMYMDMAWSLHSVDSESSEASINAVSSKRDILFEHIYFCIEPLPKTREGRSVRVLSCRVCLILAEMWCLFKKSKYTSTKLEILGYKPDISVVQKFWKLCEQHLNISDETEDEDANDEYIEDTNRDAVMIASCKLVANDTVSKEYLGPEIISHFATHGARTSEIIKHLITSLRKNANNDMPALFLEALKRAYQRHVVNLANGADQSITNKSYADCKKLATRLSATYIAFAGSKHKSEVFKVVQDGISFAFTNTPKQLSFLEMALLPFVSKLPSPNLLEILNNVERRTARINPDEDPSGWRPYKIFREFLREKLKNEGAHDEKDGTGSRRRGRPRKAGNVAGKKLFDDHESSEEDTINESDQRGQEDDDDVNQPLIHLRSASKLGASRTTVSGNN